MVEERKIRVDLWFGNRKQLACIRTVCSHIDVCTYRDHHISHFDYESPTRPRRPQHMHMNCVVLVFLCIRTW